MVGLLVGHPASDLLRWRLANRLGRFRHCPRGRVCGYCANRLASSPSCHYRPGRHLDPVDLRLDVCLSWGTAEHWGSVVAALVELPVAILLATSAALLMRRSFTVIAQLRGQDPTPVPLWRQPMIHFAPTRIEQGDESAGSAR